MPESLYQPTTPAISARRKALAPGIHDAFDNFSRAGHTKLARRTGAEPQEIMEAIWVAAEMRAGGAFARSTLALNAMNHRVHTTTGEPEP
ncbi:carboxymuconolactone decarboxylase [Rhodococcus wratislaviensis IFP 2016]|nr:carboxymuconolactone decarboxylase [Rhodococcus wratislaviensis IFP 2016]